MSASMVAHLNGGPNDDRLMDVQSHEFWVVKPATPRWLSRPLLDQEIATTYGRYVMRRNFAGDPVPHDLESVEFDWAGWF